MLPSVTCCVVVLSVLSIGNAITGYETTTAPVLSEEATPAQRIRIVVTFENLITNDGREFWSMNQLYTARKPAYDIMRDIAKAASSFRFTTREHKEFGHFVTHVRGVEADWNEKMYWAFLRRTAGGDCYLPLGISSYIPSDGENIVLSLQRYPNNLPPCSTFAKSVNGRPSSAQSEAKSEREAQSDDLWDRHSKNTDAEDVPSTRHRRAVLDWLIPRPRPPGVPRPPPRPHPPRPRRPRRPNW